MIALRRAAPICGGARIPRITRQRVDRPTALRIPLLRVAQVAFGNVPSSRGQGTSFQGPLLIERRMGFGTPGPEQAMAPYVFLTTPCPEQSEGIRVEVVVAAWRS
ncbi:uncharacterized protein CLUP02_08300 [Colletotrichum lupini]|uniref:Uncharacterized protein n=1 Tax=Colletotrichum lupini TaxID=145971 RepID=A0A9Q8STK7_9PEZI|nr:uncharacterized protein CLUP02_08300 [Colletotrichum lupini]UQC82810.1 hypothetical protein CLUP02_08300 [Colletotrichum lupini]